MTASEADVSVVLVADSLDAVRAALQCYGTERRQMVIAAVNGASISTSAIHDLGFDQVVVIDGGDGRLDVAEARAARASTAPWVLFAQAHAFPRPGAVDVLMEACRSGSWTVVGPSIGNANPETAISRAAMRIKHGRWANGQPGGLRADVPGHNSAYRREALLALGDDLDASLEAGWQLQHELLARGGQCYFEAAALVDVVNPDRVGPFVRDLWRLGRQFGHQRRRRWFPLRRLVYAAGAPAIPAVRLVRLVADAVRRGDTTIWRQLPVVSLGLIASAVGEAVGYLIGPPSRVRFVPR